MNGRMVGAEHIFIIWLLSEPKVDFFTTAMCPTEFG